MLNMSKEINSVAVRISLLPPCTEVFSFGPRGVVLQLFKSTVTRGQAPVDFPLEIPLLRTILPAQMFYLWPTTPLDPAFPLYPLLDPNPVLSLCIFQSLSTILCMRAGTHALGR